MTTEATEFADALDRLAALYRAHPDWPVPTTVGETFRVDVYQHVRTEDQLADVLTADPDRVVAVDTSTTGACAFEWDFGALVYRRFAAGELVGVETSETVTRFQPKSLDDLRADAFCWQERVHQKSAAFAQNFNDDDNTSSAMAAYQAER